MALQPIVTPPTTTATRLVRSLLSANPYLTTQQIFTQGTAGERPILQPDHELTTDGRVRMKKAANVREGRKVWQPMPVARFPGHPFRSMNFLKSTVLTSLASQGLVEKISLERPFESEEEEEEAIKTAARYTRRLERKAEKEGVKPPPPATPKMTVTMFAWRLTTPRATTESGAGEGSRSVRPPTMSSNDKLFTERARSLAEKSQWDLKWDRADRLEQAYHADVEQEAIAIDERRTARREQFRLQREREKEKVAMDRKLGRTGEVAAEKRRKEALEQIRSYAMQTGEDVSGWFEELGVHVKPDMREEERWEVGPRGDEESALDGMYRSMGERIRDTDRDRDRYWEGGEIRRPRAEHDYLDGPSFRPEGWRDRVAGSAERSRLKDMARSGSRSAPMNYGLKPRSEREQREAAPHRHSSSRENDAEDQDHRSKLPGRSRSGFVSIPRDRPTTFNRDSSTTDSTWRNERRPSGSGDSARTYSPFLSSREASDSSPGRNKGFFGIRS